MSPPQRERRGPPQHNIQEGRVDRPFSSFPFLQAITPNNIRVTVGSFHHITGIVSERLYDLNMEPDIIPPNFEQKIIDEVRRSVVRGIVLYNHPAEDATNDRQLEVYSYIDFSKIDPSIIGKATLKILCRLSLKTGILSLRTIQRNFKVS